MKSMGIASAEHYGLLVKVDEAGRYFPSAGYSSFVAVDTDFLD